MSLKQQELDKQAVKDRLNKKSEIETGQIHILVPETIAHTITNGFTFGLLFGVGMAIGLLVSVLILAAILGYLVLKVSP